MPFDRMLGYCADLRDHNDRTWFHENHRRYEEAKKDFLALLEGRTAGVSSDITRSVESHLMACAADESRRTGKTVEIAAFRQQHQKG